MLNIILAEDHNIVRNGIKMLLVSEPEFSVIGETNNGAEVLEMVADASKADIVLADINMAGMDGIALTKILRDRNPEVCVVILSMLDNEKYVFQAFQEGACGYLLKNVSSDELIFCLKHVAMGGHYLCSELSMRLLNKLVHSPSSKQNMPNNIDFSTREIEVLNLISEGLTNAEMSDKLFISKRTVEGHRQSLIEKTESKNTASLMKYAFQNGLI